MLSSDFLLSIISVLVIASKSPRWSGYTVAMVTDQHEARLQNNRRAALDGRRVGAAPRSGDEAPVGHQGAEVMSLMGDLTPRDSRGTYNTRGTL